MRRFIVVVAALATLVSACHGGGGTGSGSDVFSNAPEPTDTSTMGPPESSTPTASPTPPALPADPPATKGPPSPSCVKGWMTPPAGAPKFTDPLGVIRRLDPTLGKLAVVDMRYFVGPESPPSEQGYLQDIERWYIKLYDAQDLSYQGRFLVEQMRFGRGVVAVAPYDTQGFSSPDWSGFQWDAGDPARNAYAGLPGTWPGIRYDFVTGGAGLTIPGLPAEVVGCLDGT